MSTFPSSIASLESLAKKVANPPQPYDYSKGRTSKKVYIPENYLCFVRTRNQLIADQKLETYKQHHRFVLIVALKGSGYVGADTELASLRQGQAFLLFPFQSHFYPMLSPQTKWLFITFDLPGGDLLRSDVATPLVPLSRDGLLATNKFLQHWLKPGDRPHCALWLSLILTEFQENDSPSSEQPTDTKLVLLKKIGDYIQANLATSFSIDAIARHVGLSSSRLQHVFQDLTGRALGQHVRQLRLRRACGLLHATERSIADIAGQCGFDSIYTFSRAFKREYGLSPSEYRQSSPVQLTSLKERAQSSHTTKSSE